MHKKLVFVLVLVALVAITNAQSRRGDPGAGVNFDDGEGGINIVDQDQQVNIVDGAELQEDSYARGGGNE